MPVLEHSISAISAAAASIASAQARNIRCRSATLIRRQSPRSKAARADVIARCTNASSASGISAITSSLAGFTTEIGGPWPTRDSESMIALGDQVIAKVPLDRKSVVEGKSVAVSVDLGGGRIINKKIE